MADYEDKIRKYFGVPVEQVAGNAGHAIDDMYSKLMALRAMRAGRPIQQMPTPQATPSSYPASNNTVDYNKQTSDQDARLMEAAKKEMEGINRAEAPVDLSQYTSYAHGGTTGTGGADGIIQEDEDNNNEQTDLVNHFIKARINELQNNELLKRSNPQPQEQKHRFAEGGTVNGFPQLDGMMKPTSGKATAELEASRNPMKFIKDHKNMSIKGRKGVAF